MNQNILWDSLLSGLVLSSQAGLHGLKSSIAMCSLWAWATHRSFAGFRLNISKTGMLTGASGKLCESSVWLCSEWHQQTVQDWRALSLNNSLEKEWGEWKRKPGLKGAAPSLCFWTQCSLLWWMLPWTQPWLKGSRLSFITCPFPGSRKVAGP